MHVPSLLNQRPRIMASEKIAKSGDNRRSNKPIMEKRRRARINSCLNDLKTLILEAMKKDPSRHSKLEKADILEMTVKYLQNLQRQQVALTLAADPQVINEYRAGYGECAKEVSRYVSRLDNVDPNVCTRLLNHLAGCLSSITPSRTSTPASNKSTTPLGSPMHIQIPTGQVNLIPPVACDVVSGIQLVPSRLPNGELAFLLPTSTSSSGTHLMPLYTTRATSPSHTVSSNASTLSPIGSDFSDVSSPTPSPFVGSTGPHIMPAPPADTPQNLSLSKKSCLEDNKDSMWRPW